MPQRTPALGAILLHPAGHALTDHFHLVGNLGLMLPLLDQVNGWEAAFLQGIEIALHSGRVLGSDWTQPTLKSIAMLCGV
jgi:hypothetical protein